jgi:hypothetical protein
MFTEKNVSIEAIIIDQIERESNGEQPRVWAELPPESIPTIMPPPNYPESVEFEVW